MSAEQQPPEEKPVAAWVDKDAERYYPFKLLSMPLICVADQIDGKEGFQKDLISYTRRIYANIIMIIFIIIAALLAWDCNKNESTVMRFASTFIAAIFSFWYLLFYLIYRVIAGNRCS